MLQAHHFKWHVTVRVGVVGQHVDGHRLAGVTDGAVGVGDRFLVVLVLDTFIASAEGRQRGGVDVGDTVPAGQGRWHQLELAGVLDIPAQQHGGVLVLSVVAMLQVGPGEFAEADRNVHVLRAVDAFADEIDVLACPFFPFRRRLAVTVEDDAFFEMHVHRVTPAVAAVPDFPHFQGAVAGEPGRGRTVGQLRGGADPAWVHGEAWTAVGLDGPGLFVGAVGAAKDELAMPRQFQFGLHRRVVAVQGQRDHGLAGRFSRFGGFEVGGVHAHVLAGIRLDHHLHELAHRRVASVPFQPFAAQLEHCLVLAGQDIGQAQCYSLWTLAVVVLHQVDEIQLVAGLDPVFRKVDDDVVTLGDALGGQDSVVVLHIAVGVQVHAAVERHGVFHEVAVVGDHVERHAGVRQAGTGRAGEFTAGAGDFTHQRDPEIARHRSIEDAEAIAARPHVQARLVQPVDQNLIAEKAIGVERVEPQLAIGVPSLVGHYQVHIVVAVAPGQCRTAGQTQVDAVLQRFVATIHGAVVVHHHRVALVDVLRGEIEHVVMEPVGTHGFTPVATDLDAAVVAGLEARRGIVDIQGFARGAGERRARILGAGVDGVVTGQLQRPAIVVVLPRKEKRIGKTVAFGGGVAVVFVGTEGVQAKPHVGRRIDRQGVVVTHQHRLAVAHHQQFWRKGAVEGPERLVVLNRHVGVKTDIYAFGGARNDRGGRGLVVEPTGPELTDGVVVQLSAVAHAVVELGARLRGLEGDLWEELVPALVRPAFSWRTTFGRRADRMAVEESFDLRFPRIAVQHVGKLRWKRVQPRLAQEGFQCRPRRAAAGDVVRVLLGGRADNRNREGQGRCR
ncbi:hypothetical protein D3C73_674940 [compost metagenome]